MSVKVETVENRLHLLAPYNQALPAKAKALGGRFDGIRKTWHFDPRDEGRVRELAIAMYGTDGDTGAGDLVTVLIECSNFDGHRRIEFAGRIVLEKRHRDDTPVLGTGVLLASGAFTRSAGSRANPVIGENDAVIQVRDVPRAAAERWGTGLMILEGITDVAALEAERAKLVARLAEIDGMLEAAAAS